MKRQNQFRTNRGLMTLKDDLSRKRLRNNFMRVAKERNPYLNRICSHQPHKYGFKIDSGKYFLLAPDGSEKDISKIGTFKPKFRKQVTGFASPQQRKEAAKLDPNALHFTPHQSLAKQNSRYTPFTRKFQGYAQQPYRLKGQKLQYLNNPDEPHGFSSFKQLAKSFSQKTERIEHFHKKNISAILQHSATAFIEKGNDQKFYEQSLRNQTCRKPLPRQAKKSCYNYRCKNMKYFTFEEREKTKEAVWTQYVSMHGSGTDTTRAKSFYDRQLETEKKEMDTMKSTCG